MSNSYISMTFITDESKKASINIKKLKDGITDAEVKNVMDTISANKVLATSAGTFINKDSAKLVIIEEKPYVLS